MNNDFFNHSTFNILYFKYRDFFFPVGVIIVCLIVFVLFLLPQIDFIIQRQNDVNTLRDQITSLQHNVQLLTSLSSSDMTTQLELVDKALPQDKDFGIIIDAVNQAASLSNSSVGDYGFNIGDLSGQTTGTTNGTKNTTVNVGLSLIGDPINVAQFVTQVKKQLPLADVAQVQGNLKSASVSLVFYYLPLDKVSVSATDNFTPLSVDDLRTLQTLQTFQGQ